MDGLRYTFLHNSWATRQLLQTCRGLTPEQLEATVPGAFGSLLATLNHVVESEGLRFRVLLAGDSPDWSRRRDETPDLETVAARAEDNEHFWNDYLASPIDAERPVEVPFQGRVYEVTAGVILAQAIHHGNAHREQVCAILTVLGIEPPDISGWGFGGTHGHIVEVGPPRAE